jgi:hypothetical protein
MEGAAPRPTVRNPWRMVRWRRDHHKIRCAINLYIFLQNEQVSEKVRSAIWRDDESSGEMTTVRDWLMTPRDATCQSWLEDRTDGWSSGKTRSQIRFKYKQLKVESQRKPTCQIISIDRWIWKMTDEADVRIYQKQTYLLELVCC